MLDFVAEHPWACLLFLIALLVGVEFVVNRENWKKRSAEVTVTFVGVFAAIVFALAQGKYDREQEGRDKAVTLLKAAEIELSAIMAEYEISPPDDSMPVEEKPSFDDEKLSKMQRRLKSEAKDRIDREKTTAFPVFEAVVKEPEILSRFPHHIVYSISNRYRWLQGLVRFSEIRHSASYEIYEGNVYNEYKNYPEKRQEDIDYSRFLKIYMQPDLWENFAGTQFTLCALRISIELDRLFNDNDYVFWVKKLKNSCVNAEKLPNNRGPKRLPYVEALVEFLKDGPS